MPGTNRKMPKKMRGGGMAAKPKAMPVPPGMRKGGMAKKADVPPGMKDGGGAMKAKKKAKKKPYFKPGQEPWNTSGSGGAPGFSVKKKGKKKRR